MLDLKDNFRNLAVKNRLNITVPGVTLFTEDQVRRFSPERANFYNEFVLASKDPKSKEARDLALDIAATTENRMLTKEQRKKRILESIAYMKAVGKDNPVLQRELYNLVEKVSVPVQKGGADANYPRLEAARKLKEEKEALVKQKRAVSDEENSKDIPQLDLSKYSDFNAKSEIETLIKDVNNKSKEFKDRLAAAGMIRERAAVESVVPTGTATPTGTARPTLLQAIDMHIERMQKHEDAIQKAEAELEEAKAECKKATESFNKIDKEYKKIVEMNAAAKLEEEQAKQEQERVTTMNEEFMKGARENAEEKARFARQAREDAKNASQEVQDARQNLPTLEVAAVTAQKEAAKVRMRHEEAIKIKSILTAAGTEYEVANNQLTSIDQEKKNAFVVETIQKILDLVKEAESIARRDTEAATAADKDATPSSATAGTAATEAVEVIKSINTFKTKVETNLNQAKTTPTIVELKSEVKFNSTASPDPYQAYITKLKEGFETAADTAEQDLKAAKDLIRKADELQEKAEIAEQEAKDAARAAEDPLTRKIIDFKNSANLLVKRQMMEYDEDVSQDNIRAGTSDCVIFIVFTYFLQVVGLNLVEWMMTSGLVSDMSQAVMAYLVVYIMLFGLVVVTVAFSPVSVSNVLFLFSPRVPRGVVRILVHLVPYLFMFMLWSVLKMKKIERTYRVLTLGERKQMVRKLSKATFVLWIITSVFVFGMK